MGMSDAHRKTMLESTRPAAAALLEDLQHMREILARADPSPGEIRRLSVTLRRLLVNGEITCIAAPRMGRFRFLAPDNKPYYKVPSNVMFFSSGALITGVASSLPRLALYTSNRIPDSNDLASWTTAYATVLLNLDGFLGQRVLYLRGRWVNRRETIKYVAIVAHGAHSNAPETESEKVLSAISNGVKIRRSSEEGYHIDFVGKFGFDAYIQPFRYVPGAINPVLIELLAAAAFTVNSEDTKRLEAILTEELR